MGVSACFFHLTQNIYRQVQKADFTTKYGTDEEYAHAIRMLPALAFLKTNDDYSSFEDTGDLQIPDLDPPSEIAKLQHKDKSNVSNHILEGKQFVNEPIRS